MTGDIHAEPLLPWKGVKPLDDFVAALITLWNQSVATSQEGTAKMVRKYQGGAESLAKHFPELAT